MRITPKVPMLPLKVRETRTSTELGDISHITVDGTGAHFSATIESFETIRQRTYLRVWVEFEWRDMWLGLFWGKSDRRYLVLVPMFPIVFQVCP